MVFAALTLEREPMKWAELPMALRGWAQTAGLVAALALIIWTINWVVQNRMRHRSPMPRTASGRIFLLFLGISAGLFAFLGLTLLGRQINIRALAEMSPGADPMRPTIGNWLFTFAGAAALLAVAMPVLYDVVFRMRWGRIWALARLSLKEAIRSRVVLIFGLITLVFLFADWFVPYKPEDQLRNYVAVIYLSLPPLFLVTASLLGAFSIPADIRSQSIHTIVTKPVEKFEIVLGRFIGYAILMTVGLAVVAGLSLGYVVRGIHPDAAKESFKARVPIYGELGFDGTRGESVGRVWGYRKYIGGRSAGAKEQYAVWSFEDLPSELGRRAQPVAFEFTFDIYRMTKGQEDRGVFCDFLFIDGRLDRDEMQSRLSAFREDRKKYQDLVTKLSAQPAAEVLTRVEEQVKVDYPREGPEAVKLAQAHRAEAGEAKLDNLRSLRQEVESFLVLLHGVYEPATVEVKDYHTQAIEVPPQLFRYLNSLETAKPREEGTQGFRLPMMRVWVNINSSDATRATNAPQMLGVARADLYLLAAEKPFWQNFLKGILGLWFTFVLVLGIAVPLSTYLSGVITWLCTMFLFGAGIARDFVKRLSEGTHEGGGPMQSIYRIFNQTFHSGQLDESPTITTLKDVDAVYQFVFRLVYSILPDVNRYDLQEYVANGFDIAWGRVLFLDCFLPLVGYLLPWMILGYYLIKYREIANPN